MLVKKTLPPIQKTLPELFIIESLDEEDERERSYEGRALSNALMIARKSPRYFYLRNERELPHVVNLFRESQHRFLHISAHGNNCHIGLTHSTLTFKEFASFFTGHLSQRRVFMSICYSGNQELIEQLVKGNKGIQSVVAPVSEISFDVSLAFRTALYIALFNEDTASMRHEKMVSVVCALAKVFKEKFYIGLFNSTSQTWTHLETEI